MTSLALRRQLMASNPANRPPSYADMGKTKPKKKGGTDNNPTPLRFIVCKKCKKHGGTLIHAGKYYYHKECLAENK